MEPAIIAATVGVFLWLATRAYEIYVDRARKASQATADIRALYAEIDFNTRDMELFLNGPSPLDRIIRKLSDDPNFTPHVTDARHTEIYRTRVRDIHTIGEGLIGRIVYFYGLMEKIKSQIDGLHLPSYRTISAEGRGNVIKNIYRTCEECQSVGELLLADMAARHPSLGLARVLRANDDDLPSRLAALSSNLDRVRSKFHDHLL